MTAERFCCDELCNERQGRGGCPKVIRDSPITINDKRWVFGVTLVMLSVWLIGIWYIGRIWKWW